MGKILEKYNLLKSNNSNKRYMFQSGLFYIFVDEDAKYISSVLNFKITSFGNTVKCGFPIKAYPKYKDVLEQENVVLVSQEMLLGKIDSIISFVNKIDINNLTPIEAMQIFAKLKDIIKNEQ